MNFFRRRAHVATFRYLTGTFFLAVIYRKMGRLQYTRRFGTELLCNARSVKAIRSMSVILTGFLFPYLTDLPIPLFYATQIPLNGDNGTEIANGSFMQQAQGRR